MLAAVSGEPFVGGCNLRIPGYRRIANRWHRRVCSITCRSKSSDLGELRASLAEAVNEENYQLAARLRDEIADLESQDQLLVLNKELEKAIAQENYEVN